MSNDPTLPNPDLVPAGPAITKDEAGNYVLDPKRPPGWKGPCASCAHFQALGRTSEHRQTYTAKDGTVKKRLFLTWQRFCLVGPETIEIADEDIAWCSTYKLHDDGGAFANLIGSPVGNTPFATEEE